MPSEAAALRLLDGVAELGVQHFDTAPAYGRGYAELILGAFVRRRPRDSVVIATKFGAWPQRSPWLAPALALPLNFARRRLGRRAPPTPPSETREQPPSQRPRITLAAVAAQFEASLRALRVDYIDLYLVHEATVRDLEPAAADWLRALKERGRIRRLGLAANGAAYADLTPDDLTGWDLLQYESGPAWPGNADLPARFPEQQHIFHSCLRHLHDAGDYGSAAVGQALRERLAAHPSAGVLFSSTRLAHVQANLAAVTS